MSGGSKEIGIRITGKGELSRVLVMLKAIGECGVRLLWAGRGRPGSLWVVAFVFCWAGMVKGQTNAELDRMGLNAMRAYLKGDVNGAIRIVDGVIRNHSGALVAKRYYFI